MARFRKWRKRAFNPTDNIWTENHKSCCRRKLINVGICNIFLCSGLSEVVTSTMCHQYVTERWCLKKKFFKIEKNKEVNKAVVERTKEMKNKMQSIIRGKTIFINENMTYYRASESSCFIASIQSKWEIQQRWDCLPVSNVGGMLGVK